MIAVVTVIGAGVACRAAIASSNASDADFNGLVAAINAEEAAIVNAVTTYQHYHAYTTYLRYNELGNIAAEETLPEMARLKREAWGLALGLQYSFFPPRYLNPDGTYDTQRELDESWAEQEQQKDLQPEPHFAAADLARLKTSLLTGALIVFAVAFWFFTLAQAINNRLKYLMVTGGFGFTFIGLFMFGLVEALL